MFKVIKKILKILRIIVVVLILLNFVPVKFAIQEEDIDYTKEFYIVHFQLENECYISGDKDNLHKNERILVELSGKDPRNKLRNSICTHAGFVIYGTLEQNNQYRYTLHSDKWELFKNNGFRSITPRHILNIYDYSITGKFSVEIFSCIVIIASVLFALLEKLLKKIRKTSR